MAGINWLQRRNRAIHITIRDVDCRDFDVPRFVADLKRWQVTFFSFFAGGYVTTYPTALRYQRTSPQLGGRDLTGEIVDVSHRHGIQVFPMIDLGMVPELAAREHPEWVSVDATGAPYRMQFDGPYRACILGGYVRDYSREFVREILERYPVDGIKYGGASYGFNREICYCDTCRRRFREERGFELPMARDWSDPAWHAFIDWRMDMVVETVRHLNDIVKELDPSLPITGNSVCYGDPGWTMRASFDIERMAAAEEGAQVEIQTRFNVEPTNDQVNWQYMRWPAETASFMDAVSDRPFWAVASYFVAWPWRRNAAPYHEQKAYLSLAVAHGASVMVNLSGGPPAVHEDRRGFLAVDELYGFMAQHNDYLQGDRSPARIAIVFSLDTLAHWGGEDKTRYVDALRGWEQALWEAHIPFDIISHRMVTEERSGQYDLLILPNAACMTDGEAAALERFAAQGGSLILTHETGLYQRLGKRRDRWPLAELVGADYVNTIPVLDPRYSDAQQAYWRVAAAAEPLSWLDAGLLPAMGRCACVRPRVEDMTIPLTRAASFRVFPEGLSYPEHDDPGDPGLILRELPGGGRLAYFAGHVGLTYFRTHLPDYGQMLAETARWAYEQPQPLLVDAPSTLHTSLRVKGTRTMVHLVNLTGGERFWRQVIPLRDVRLGLQWKGDELPLVTQLSSGQRLPVERADGYSWVTVPMVVDYDIVAFEEL